MREASDDELQTQEAPTWRVRLLTDGTASLAGGRWPVAMVLENPGAQARHVDPRGLLQIRVRSRTQGRSLSAIFRPVPGPRLRVEPGAQLRLPLNLLEWLGSQGALLPGPQRVRLTWLTDQGPLRSPALDCELGA